MNEPGDELKTLVEAAPIGVVIVDRGREIVMANSWAVQQLGLPAGSSLQDHLGEDALVAIDQVLAEPGKTAELNFERALGNKAVEVIAAAVGDEFQHALFVSDISEKIALGRQLQSSRKPSRRLLYQLNSAATAMMGYTELIELMLEEEGVISGERLVVVRRYHKEVRKSLETIHRLLKVERDGGRRPDSTAIPMTRQQVVIVDTDPAVVEYIAELMKGLQFRVSTFTEASRAFTFCREETEKVGLVIVDESLPGSSDAPGYLELLELGGNWPLIVCAREVGNLPDMSRVHPCEKPIDISDLTRIVSDLLPD